MDELAYMKVNLTGCMPQDVSEYDSAKPVNLLAKIIPLAQRKNLNHN